MNKKGVKVLLLICYIMLLGFSINVKAEAKTKEQSVSFDIKSYSIGEKIKVVVKNEV